MAMLPRLVRDRSRQALKVTLRCVPDRAFAPLRASFAATGPTTVTHRGQELLLNAARYRGVPAELDSFVLTDNPEVRIANADSFIVEWLYWFGERYGYEPAVIKWWKVFCASSSHIVEFGANIGYFIVQGAPMGIGARYVAVEPHPGCAALCRRNVQLNGITNVEVVEAAAVAQQYSPTVELMLPGGRDHYDEAPCTGFVGVSDVHGAGQDRSGYAAVTVPAVPVTSLIDGDTDLVKMDVEGQEHVLLSAVLDRLKESRPTVFLELLDNTPHLRALILTELLPAGYYCFVPTMDELVPLSGAAIAAVSLTAEHGTRDIILSPTPLAEILARLPT